MTYNSCHPRSFANVSDWIFIRIEVKWKFECRMSCYTTARDSNVEAIPNDATATAILHSFLLASIKGITKIFPVPPGASMKNELLSGN